MYRAITANPLGAAAAGNGLVVSGGTIGISPTTGPAQSDNRVINGDFIVDQYNEFASFTPTTTAYGPDRWRWGIVTAGAFTAQSLTASPPPGLANYFTVTVANAQTLASTDAYSFQQRIEGANIADLGWGTAAARPVVVSFWAKASVSGNYSFAIKNAPITQSYVSTFNIGAANTWAFYSFVVVGPTAGTFLTARNTDGFLFSFDLGSGSTVLTSTLNAWQAGNFAGTTGANTLVTNAAATLSLSNVRLYASTFALPYSQRPYGLELELCQRYFRKSFPAGTVPAQSAGVAGAICVKNPIALGDPSVYVAFAPQMMAAPTIVTFNPSAANANWRDVTAASDATVSVDPASAKGPSGVLLATSGAITTLGDVLAIHYTAQSEL